MTAEAVMVCPKCQGELVYWSESAFGSFGNACLKCKLFVWYDMDAPEHPTYTKPLDLAHFPRAYRSIPRYREAVGWIGE